jgi:hypothetical protein
MAMEAWIQIAQVVGSRSAIRAALLLPISAGIISCSQAPDDVAGRQGGATPSHSNQNEQPSIAQRPVSPFELNESEVQSYEREEKRGDVQAAEKLWDHYVSINDTKNMEIYELRAIELGSASAKAERCNRLAFQIGRTSPQDIDHQRAANSRASLNCEQ